ncbi:peroxisomal membrane protein Pex17p [Monosporozyma unispora]|nr:hypothetical protein C6P44_000078 [Kazachstania unispora]
MDNIEWPQESQIRGRVKYRVKDEPIVKFIQKLCYNTGIASSILYFITLALVQPSLQRLYRQRQELALVTLLRLRKSLVSLVARIKTQNISQLEFNKTATTVSRYVQTDESPHTMMDEDREEEEREYYDSNDWTMVNTKLKQINYILNQRVIIVRHLDSMEYFNFQVKLLIDQIDSYDDKSTELHEKAENIRDSIREMKGWFVNGRIS